MMRQITGYGEGNGPFISIHDGFDGVGQWANFLPGSDRIALDTHPYFAFDGSAATAPIDTGTGDGAGGTWPAEACRRWAPAQNQRYAPDYAITCLNLIYHLSSRVAFGVTVAGEFSNGINDCGLFLRGIPSRTSYGGNCADWEDSSNWSEGTKAGLLKFALANMDTFGDYFFWTWKVCLSLTIKVL